MTSLQREAAGRVRRAPAFASGSLELVAARFGFDRVSVFHTHPGALPQAHTTCCRSPFLMRRPRRPNARGGRLPAWLKRPLPAGNGNFFTQTLLEDLRLETVCENARCPNRPECWSRRTATFMILGNVCTRPCGFCSVPKGEPLARRGRRTGPRRGGGRPARPQARRHHVGHARRPARRRGGPLRPLRRSPSASGCRAPRSRC